MEETIKLLSEMNENMKIVLRNLDVLINLQSGMAVDLEDTLEVTKKMKDERRPIVQIIGGED